MTRQTTGGILGLTVLVIGMGTAVAVAAEADDKPESAIPPKPGILAVDVDSHFVTIRAGDRPIVRYRYGQVAFKPYADRLYTPSGQNILRDAPHDHLHHHGLMFAMAVDGVNFWEEKETSGKQRHLGIKDVKVVKARAHERASFTEMISWINPANEAELLREERTLTVIHHPKLRVSMLTWQSALSLEDRAEAELSGAFYFGLGMRFIESMDKFGDFVNSEGRKGMEDTTDKPAKWCAYTAKAEGKPVTVALFDHPENNRHPAVMFTMLDPFSYLSATLDLHHRTLPIDKDRPMTLRYGIALWDGQVQPEAIKKLYERWAAIPSRGNQGQAAAGR